MSAWTFCVHVLGFDDPENVCSSLRCIGAAHRLLLTKAPTKQKATLLMDMVYALELATAHALRSRTTG